MSEIRDTGIQRGYMPVVRPVADQVVSQHHVVTIAAPGATQRRFRAARWVPWIVLAALFVLSPYFTLIVTLIYGFFFTVVFSIPWLGGRDVQQSVE